MPGTPGAALGGRTPGASAAPLLGTCAACMTMPIPISGRGGPGCACGARPGASGPACARGLTATAMPAGCPCRTAPPCMGMCMCPSVVRYGCTGGAATKYCMAAGCIPAAEEALGCASAVSDAPAACLGMLLAAWGCWASCSCCGLRSVTPLGAPGGQKHEARRGGTYVSQQYMLSCSFSRRWLQPKVASAMIHRRKQRECPVGARGIQTPAKKTKGRVRSSL